MAIEVVYCHADGDGDESFSVKNVLVVTFLSCRKASFKNATNSRNHRTLILPDYHPYLFDNRNKSGLIQKCRKIPMIPLSDKNNYRNEKIKTFIHFFHSSFFVLPFFPYFIHYFCLQYLPCFILSVFLFILSFYFFSFHFAFFFFFFCCCCFFGGVLK